MGNYAKDIDNKYIGGVDCFSKFLWTRPIKIRVDEVPLEDSFNKECPQIYKPIKIFYPKITDNYNESRHSTTGYKPIDVTKSKEKLILKTVYNHIKISGVRKFKVGDIVRISKNKLYSQKVTHLIGRRNFSKLPRLK
ncbi:hypothetical protein NQ315_011275 [Exocentrus adspersus]|uniref:Uncharacterized protein n=1 Tax=Exocentrus adspersus TaxID=1586481 RepID=A0AAV8VJT9_9CUCU|nr:hypothetical protein NQ315_011275 [Exocentrus adspersus]